jgi:hypothetical protein
MDLKPNLGGSEIFPAVQTGPEAHPCPFQYNGHSSQSMLLTTHLILVLASEGVGAVLAPPLSACIGVSLCNFCFYKCKI